jgi:hypothetical protein
MDKRRQLRDPYGRTRSLLFGAAIDRLYDRAGKDEVLGRSMTMAEEAYRTSLVADVQPGSWLEVPLVGEPGYDINVFYRSGQLVPGDRFVFGEGFGYQPVMDWLARVKPGKFGVGIAHDLQGPTPGHGVYVNPNGIGVTQRNGFFEALDEAGAGARSAAIVARQPAQWETMEEGVFASRPERPARIASRVGDALQKAYASDASLLKAHLRQVGFGALDADMLACLQEMATIVRLDAEPNAPFFLMTSSPTFVKAKWVPGMAPLSKIYQSCDAKLLR